MAKESEGSQGFPGVRSLFGRGGFPGTIKLSRKARSDTGERQGGSAAGVEEGLRSLSLASGNGAEAGAAAADEEPLPSSSSHPSAPCTTDDSYVVVRPSSSQEESGPSSSGEGGGVQVAELRSMSNTRLTKFKKVLEEPTVDLDALRELAWSGVPPQLRSMCWRLLLGYLPPNSERRDAIVARKRREYRDLVPEYYDMASSMRSEDELGALRQVAVDVPRTAPGVAFFHQPQIQKQLERILYIWGIRHPASGYVQGINDLVTPFLAAFLGDHFEGAMEAWELQQLSEDEMLGIEADCYWCLCKLLDGIQDHYTYAQPGIQRTLFHVHELVRRVDEPLAAHLEQEGLEFIQFAFRWVNCLLLRELPFSLGVRLWDTYLAEGTQLRDFLVYVLAAFLLSWSERLRQLEFQDLIMFLQKPPTAGWSEKDVELVLSRAYMWRASFKDASSHFA